MGSGFVIFRVIPKPAMFNKPAASVFCVYILHMYAYIYIPILISACMHVERAREREREREGGRFSYNAVA